MKYLMHIRPPEELGKRLVSLRLAIKPYIMHMYRNVPHCTLFITYTDPSDESKLISSLEKVSCPPVSMGLGELDLFDGDNLVVRVEKNDELQKLHYRVIAAGMEHFDKEQRPPSPAKYEDDMERKIAHVTFGSPYFGKFYRPHITVSEVEPRSFKTILEKHKEMLKGFSWEATEFWLSRKAEEWEIIKRFSM